MKTHINQILTVVSFFSLSISTILAISWAMNGLIINENAVVIQCLNKHDISINEIKSKTCIDANKSIQLQLAKNTLKANG